MGCVRGGCGESREGEERRESSRKEGRAVLQLAEGRLGAGKAFFDENGRPRSFLIGW